MTFRWISFVSPLIMPMMARRSTCSILPIAAFWNPCGRRRRAGADAQRAARSAPVSGPPSPKAEIVPRRSAKQAAAVSDTPSMSGGFEPFMGKRERIDKSSNRQGRAALRLRSSPPRSPSLWSIQSTTKVVDYAGELSILWRDTRQALGIFKRRDDISCIPVEADERQQDVAIVRMPGYGLLQDGDSVVVATSRMQRNRVDVVVSCAVRLELGRTTKLHKGGIRLLEASERQSESMMQPCVAR